MKVLLLGASGFVGRSLIDFFLDSGEKFEVKTANRSHVAPSTYEHVQINIMDPPSVRDVGVDFDLIIHAATPASALLNSTSPKKMFKQNLVAMENVLEIASSCPTPPIVLFTSSGAVYGELPTELVAFPENYSGAASTVDVGSAYSEGKRASEFLLTEATMRGVCRGVIARLFAFSGIHLPIDRHFALGNFVRDAIVERHILVRGDGSAVRSYLDGSDMAEWLIAAAVRGRPQMCYHIGSDVPISILDLAILVQGRTERLFGYRPGIEVLGRRDHLDGVDRYVPETILTKAALSVDQKVTLDESIDKMLLHMRSLRGSR